MACVDDLFLSSCCPLVVLPLSSSCPPGVPLLSFCWCPSDSMKRKQAVQCEKTICTRASLDGNTAAWPHGSLSACNSKMTTCELALQSGEALARQLQKAAPEADVLSLSSCCPLLAEFCRRKKEAGQNVRPRWLLLSQGFSVLSSSCSSFAFLLSFFGSWLAAAASLSPVALLPSSSCLSRVLSVLSSSSPLDLLLACSPHVVLLSFWRCPATACPSFVILVCSCCFPSLILLSSAVLLMSSSGLSAVLLFTLLSEAGAGAAAAATTILAD